MAFVPFTTGSSQGDGTGAGFSAGFVAHFAGTQTLAHFPDIPVHILSIMDDFYTVALFKYLGPIFQVLSDILLDCAGIKINIPKCSLNVIQAATIANPSTAMQFIYDQSPVLAAFILQTECFECLGAPIGTQSFIDSFMQTKLASLQQKFQLLLPYQYPKDFHKFLWYCCDQKILHLLRLVGPRIVDHTQQFDHIIDQLASSYFDLRFPPNISSSLGDISSDLPSLSEDNMVQLARVQLRSLPQDGGLDLLAMSDAVFPAFYAAHCRHFSQHLKESVRGPFLSPVSSGQSSSSLFSAAFFQTQEAFQLRDAIVIRSETDIPSDFTSTGIVLPHLNLFQHADVDTAVAPVSKFLAKKSKVAHSAVQNDFW